MRSVLKEIQDTFKIPVVLVTHDFPEALELADKMIVYSEGRIQQTGTPAEIFANPSNEKVAQLLACWKRKCPSGTGLENPCYFNEKLDVICEAGHAA